MSENTTEITIRGVSQDLKQAMALRKNNLRKSREKMLLEILESEFSLELSLVQMIREKREGNVEEHKKF